MRRAKLLPKCHNICALKKKKKKSKNKRITKDAVISVRHTESSCAVLRCREVSGSHNHIPVTSACASVCVRLKNCVFVIPKCAVKKTSIHFFGIMVKSNTSHCAI